MGRAKQKQGLAQDTLERLVLVCGRPMLVAATAAPQRLTGTIMVCWKESGNAARAVAAAMPILAKAERVVFTSIVERDESVVDAVKDLARQFAWNGVATETQIIPAKGRGRSRRDGRLWRIARAPDHFRKLHRGIPPPRRPADPAHALGLVKFIR